jgi:hypothetical protein
VRANFTCIDCAAQAAVCASLPAELRLVTGACTPAEIAAGATKQARARRPRNPSLWGDAAIRVFGVPGPAEAQAPGCLPCTPSGPSFKGGDSPCTPSF